MEIQKKEPGIYLKTGQNVKTILKYYGITQAELCRRLPGRSKEDGHVKEKTMSQIVNGHARLTEDMARRILDAFPDCPFRLPWLLGMDDNPTEKDAEMSDFNHDLSSSVLASVAIDSITRSVMDLMELHGMEFTMPKDDVFHARYPLPTVARYKEKGFNTADLLRIAFKMFDALGTELDYAAETDASMLNLLTESAKTKSTTRTMELLQQKQQK